MAAGGPWTSQVQKVSQATSFDLRSADYARLRPDYPRAAIGAAVPTAARVVLDLGAGTGKLTGALIERGFEVIAVEPLAGMLAELTRLFPAAQAICGSAERIPLTDSAVDAIVVGQAFHWFDTDRALDEIARVLRPGGSLALLWNHDDESDPLVQDIYQALTAAGRPVGGTTGRGGTGASPARGAPAATDPAAAPAGSPTAPFTGHPLVPDPDVTQIRWQRTQTVEDLIGLLNTYSYVIRATDRVRGDLEQAVRSIAERHSPATDVLHIPVICQVWRSTCRSA